MIRVASTRRVRLHLKGPDELFLIGKRAPGRGCLFRNGHHPLCVLHTKHATDVSWCVVLQSFRGKLLQPRDLKISQSHESLQRNEGIQQPEAYTSKNSLSELLSRFCCLSLEICRRTFASTKAAC
jgi:hypothetical protein